MKPSFTKPKETQKLLNLNAESYKSNIVIQSPSGPVLPDVCKTACLPSMSGIYMLEFVLEYRICILIIDKTLQNQRVVRKLITCFEILNAIDPLLK